MDSEDERWKGIMLQNKLIQDRPALLWSVVPGLPTYVNSTSKRKLDNIAVLARQQASLDGHVFLEIKGSIARVAFTAPNTAITMAVFEKVRATIFGPPGAASSK